MPVGRSTVKVARPPAAHVYAGSVPALESVRAAGHSPRRPSAPPDGPVPCLRRNSLPRNQLAAWHDLGFWTMHPHRRSARC